MNYAKFGLVLIVVGWLVATAVGPEMPYLMDWSSAQVIGGNLVTVGVLGIALYVIKLSWDHTLGKKSKAIAAQS